MKILAWPNSSQITTTKYTPDTETLEVEFKSTGVYQYSKVPSEIWDKIVVGNKDPSFSIGKFVNSDIKGKYEYQKII